MRRVLIALLWVVGSIAAYMLFAAVILTVEMLPWLIQIALE